MKRLLKWTDGNNGVKIAQGKNLIFAYQKVGKRHLLLIESGHIAIRHICQTERDCLIISNILNKCPKQKT